MDYQEIDALALKAKGGDSSAAGLLESCFRPLMLSAASFGKTENYSFEDSLQEKCCYSHSKRIKKRLLKNPVNYDVFAVYINMIN